MKRDHFSLSRVGVHQVFFSWIEKLRAMELFPVVMAVGLLIGLALMEWVRVWMRVPPQPVLYTVTAGGIGLWAAFKLKRTAEEGGKWRPAGPEKRAVAEALEDLRESGFAVFHDVPGEGFNLDHVVIGPTGVFVIETKMVSKWPGRREEIIWDGKDITVGGRTLWGDPVGLARANARWLSGRLPAMSGPRVPVTPVVVFPNWSVNRRGEATDLLILNEKEIPHTLRANQVALTTERIALLRHRLAVLAQAH
jgi:Nuclease-related domain